MTAHTEIDRGERFAFGENWQRFLAELDDDRIRAADDSMRAMLGVDTLDGKRLLDLGSGSGLFSLAARRLGAEVVSVDYDPESVACGEELRRRYQPDDERWQTMSGSALDTAFLGTLGQFDVVYSWGVLHHTGDLWSALSNVVDLVAPGGQLFISIYNDQGRSSRGWTRVKKTYVRSGAVGKRAIESGVSGYFRGREAVATALGIVRDRRLPERPTRERGMSRKHDLVDWVGGYPFEVAKPEQIFDFYRDRGFELTRLKTCGGGLGCNEFVFRRRA
jgi:2-polyprenyl-6-hydroxyphenyl methylase/3-demethylubiquinone-9 3-methyltransferase